MPRRRCTRRWPIYAPSMASIDARLTWVARFEHLPLANPPAPANVAGPFSNAATGGGTAQHARGAEMRWGSSVSAGRAGWWRES